jgi:hypothetical protein
MERVTPDSLSPSDRFLWDQFLELRTAELTPSLEQSGCLSRLTSLVWVEFLTYRWAAASKIPFPDCNPLQYAHQTRAFGPDLGARPFLGGWTPTAPASDAAGLHSLA